MKKLDDVNEDFWEKRYQHINDFERYLTETGTTVIKFFLNVSKEEQKERFLKRLNNKEKNWKFSASDVEERQHWDDYMDAYGKMLTKTSTDYAPWFVIPADHKWFMRYAVGEIISQHLDKLKMYYPQLTKEETENLKVYRKLLEEEDKAEKKDWMPAKRWYPYEKAANRELFMTFLINIRKNILVIHLFLLYLYR